MSTVAEKTDWEVKVWGRTREYSRGAFWSIHNLEVVAGGYCSFHYHENRENLFRVSTGRIRVVACAGWSIDIQELGPQDECRILSRVPHQFQVLESGTLIESYKTAPSMGVCDRDDIVRLSEGGMIDSERMKSINGVLRTDGSIWKGE